MSGLVCFHAKAPEFLSQDIQGLFDKYDQVFIVWVSIRLSAEAKE